MPIRRLLQDSKLRPDEIKIRRKFPSPSNNLDYLPSKSSGGRALADYRGDRSLGEV